jgi:uncharacterized protein YjbI with pentapeptide repeats
VEANLSRAQLQNTNLSAANLSMANLSMANLVGANLDGADLNRTNLRRATLWEANLEGVDLVEANLEGVDFSDANFRRARFSDYVIEFHLGIAHDGLNLGSTELLDYGAYSTEGMRFGESNNISVVRIYFSGKDFTKADIARIKADIIRAQFSDGTFPLERVKKGVASHFSGRLSIDEWLDSPQK